MKYVINVCCGGFGLSDNAIQYLAENCGWEIGRDFKEYSRGYNGDAESYYIIKDFDSDLHMRSDKYIVAAVEALGEEANGYCSDLEIVECDYPIEALEIDEYGGAETLQTIPVRFN